jgi:hypothetical protein
VACNAERMVLAPSTDPASFLSEGGLVYRKGGK